MPTIPKIGMFISKGDGELFQRCDSAIFADAEEESPRPEKRPSAPHFSGLRRRNTDQEQGRYMDAVQAENHIEKRPSVATRFKALRSLSKSEDGHANDSKDHSEPQETMVQSFARAAHDSKSSLENETTFQESHAISTSGPADQKFDPQGGNPSSKTISRQLSLQKTEEMDHSTQPRNRLSSVVTKTLTLTTQIRQIEVVNPIRKLAEKIRTLHRRLSQNQIPLLQEKARMGYAIIVSNIALVFTFLRCCFEHLLHLLPATKVEQIRAATETHEAPSLASITEKSSSNMHGDIHSRSPDAEEDVGRQFDSDNANVSTYGSSVGIDPPQINGEKLLSAHSSQESTASHSEHPLHAPDTTGEMMTAVRHISSFNPTSGNSSKEDEIVCEEKDREKRNEHPEQINSGRQIDSQGTIDGSCHPKLPPKGNDSESHTKTFPSPKEDEAELPTEAFPSPNGGDSKSLKETFLKGRNSPEDLMHELDQSSMRFEHRASEIIISPLNPTSPAFLSDGEYDTENRRRMKYPNGEVTVPEKPVQPNSGMHQSGKSTFPKKKRNSRGPTGKLRTDVRTMKDSIFRAFGRNKVEPETRFASPRSARKTLALIADMLVKEYGCDVAVRRNGALKMRCEKVFTGNQKLKVRLAFQPMDAYSCNVIICRSREDEHHVSTTDYVGFVADVQRSFMNATSEAMLAGDGGI